MTEPEAPTRIRLDIAYDGTDFTGWARQPGLRTVQGELEDALATLFARTGEAPRLTVAGRTDVGVHAIGQVAHLDLTAGQLEQLDRRPRDRGAGAAGAESLARRVNGIVGQAADVQVLAATPAPAGFDARFSAVWRRYRYRIADAEALRDPRMRAFTLWHPARLDVEAMDAAAGELLGLHDFAAYCRPREGATTIRTLQEFGWRRDADGVLVAEVRADAFCHSMVRALVGACVAAGEGRLAPGRAARIRDEARRTSEFIVLPARGLTLVEVGYPPDAELAARAEQTRARRATPGLADEAPID
ncbi:tRNA pseudouridine(38-40) synthase TruA [Protaetiibacter intestinalis]|uniref:tRNA pseudouridine synthase A n=1 Tax=Protaetiibacter intestinalis TaxID=2419774 RepID=A0A387BGA0_9MICO|nr:tRNA pseudouridine(38-40) synthase TruA [Protaetiibacter intestinalis]AYF97530.1 tRNA pseudouridine(38-40) synthase TruA [Protaetiibacter intestinalis]